MEAEKSPKWAQGLTEEQQERQRAHWRAYQEGRRAAVAAVKEAADSHETALLKVAHRLRTLPPGQRQSLRKFLDEHMDAAGLSAAVVIKALVEATQGQEVRHRSMGSRNSYQTIQPSQKRSGIFAHSAAILMRSQ